MRFLKGGGKNWLAAILALAIALGGCAGLQGPVPPPGQQAVIAEPVPPADPLSPVFREVPAPASSSDPIDIVVSPAKSVAPVGSEVVLIASVVGPDGHLRTNERVEWAIGGGSVGQFVDVADCSPVNFLFGDFTIARKLSANYAVTSTLRRNVVLTRGTATPADDVNVVSGQTWVSVTSPVEGATYVTAVAPRIRDWTHRSETAVIYWVDAQWSFPSPAIVPAGGSHRLSTRVVRHSDGTPCQGWIVRYEIAGGVPAGFAPEGAQMVEVMTDENGCATAEIFQSQSNPGSTTVTVRIISPADPARNLSQVALGCGSVLITWSAPSLAVRKIGPAAAAVGSTLDYCIEVTNCGDMPASDVVLRDILPAGLTYLGSSPEGQPVDGSILWRLGTLQPGETRRVSLQARAESSGTIENVAEVTAAGGLSTSNSVTTQVSATRAELMLSGPQQATVGQTVQYLITITNRGPDALTGLVLRADFEAGLQHALGVTPIDRPIADPIAPGESKQYDIRLNVVQAGRWCLRVDLMQDETVLASDRVCLTAETAPAAGIAPPAGVPTAGQLAVQISAPQQCTVDELVLFTVTVQNTGTTEVRDVTVRCEFDSQLVPTRATAGFEPRPAGVPQAPFVWNVGSLPPGQSVAVQLECRAAEAVAAACVQATATSADGQQATGRTCVAVSPAAPQGPPKVTIAITPLREPVALGKQLTYVIKVANEGATAIHDAQLTVVLPPQLEPIRFGTIGPPGTADPTFTGNQVQFGTVAELAPGQQVQYRLRAGTVEAGEAVLRAELSFRESAQPITSEARTTVVPSQEAPPTM